MQHVLFNGQTLLKVAKHNTQEYRKAIFGPLLSLIYINDLATWADGLKSTCKIFADDGSLFLKIEDFDTDVILRYWCNTNIDNNLLKISR